MASVLILCQAVLVLCAITSHASSDSNDSGPDADLDVIPLRPRNNQAIKELGALRSQLTLTLQSAQCANAGIIHKLDLELGTVLTATAAVIEGLRAELGNLHRAYRMADSQWESQIRKLRTENAALRETTDSLAHSPIQLGDSNEDASEERNRPMKSDALMRTTKVMERVKEHNKKWKASHTTGNASSVLADIEQETSMSFLPRIAQHANPDLEYRVQDLTAELLAANRVIAGMQSELRVQCQLRRERSLRGDAAETRAVNRRLQVAFKDSQKACAALKLQLKKQAEEEPFHRRTHSTSPRRQTSLPALRRETFLNRRNQMVSG